MVWDSKRPPPFIGHGKVDIFLIPLAKMLNFISRVTWPEEDLKSKEMEVRFGQLPFIVVYLTIDSYTSYYKWI